MVRSRARSLFIALTVAVVVAAATATVTVAACTGSRPERAEPAADRWAYEQALRDTVDGSSTSI